MKTICEIAFIFKGSPHASGGKSTVLSGYSGWVNGSPYTCGGKSNGISLKHSVNASSPHASGGKSMT